MIILFSVVVLLVVILITFGLVFSDKVSKIAVQSRASVFDYALEVEEFSLEKYNGYVKEEVFIKSRYGYNLSGYSLRSNNKLADKVIIFSHGVTTTCFSSIKYAEFFIEDGWDVIIYDHRRHGNTPGTSTTYGFLEKHDMDSIVSFVKNKYGDDVILGIHGESMGAAITIQYAAYYGNADFYILDCPFSDLDKQMRYRLKIEFKMPGFPIIPLSNIFLKLKEGFSFSDSSPINYIDKVSGPTLFIHAKKDDYILCEMSEELYDKKIGNKSIFLAEEGGHAESFTKNRDKYKSVVREFISSISIIK